MTKNEKTPITLKKVASKYSKVSSETKRNEVLKDIDWGASMNLTYPFNATSTLISMIKKYFIIEWETVDISKLDVKMMRFIYDKLYQYEHLSEMPDEQYCMFGDNKSYKERLFEELIIFFDIAKNYEECAFLRSHEESIIQLKEAEKERKEYEEFEEYQRELYEELYGDEMREIRQEIEEQLRNQEDYYQC